MEREALPLLPTTRAALVLALFVVVLVWALFFDARPAYAKTFTVNSTGDAEDSNPGNGVCQVEGFVFGCSLRAAIEEANEYPGADTITFNLSATDPSCDSSGVCTISPTEQLPIIDDRLTINGYSQPGAKPNTLKGATVNNVVLKIELDGIGAGGLADRLIIGASNSVVKGLVINRFAGYGVLLGPGMTGVKVQGNFIGTNASGLSELGNGDSGVSIQAGASNNTIGGRKPGTRNVISGNAGNGVILGGGATRNKVQGNRIGTNKNGAFDLGNDLHGVRIFGSDNFVGGSRSGQASIIHHNGGDGVSVEGNTTTGNRILRNSMSDNGDLGIDLGDDGKTANDGFGDADPGPNKPQNYPEITSATASGKYVLVKGTLVSGLNRTFAIQIFLTSGATNDEGRFFRGKKKVTTNSNGEASFKLTIKKSDNQALDIIATATDPDGNTSEFSDPVAVT